MSLPSFKEDHISQIPALQLLQNLGYTYLTPDQALEGRGGKRSQVILEDILRRQLRRINVLQTSSASVPFSDANIEVGIQVLKNLPFQDGYIAACERAYDLLTLGHSLEQSIDGDKRSFNLQYVDWKNIENNVFHVTEEFSVLRTGSEESYRPDVVLFVNGIPFVVIECKRPDIKDSLQQAISQQLRNQQSDGIRPLFAYAQIILALAVDRCAYATSGTPEKFWAQWNEKFPSENEKTEYTSRLTTLKNTALSDDQKNVLFGDRYKYVRPYFDTLLGGGIMPTLQDEYLLNLCDPKRLLDLVFGFIMFDGGEKKIARYQQYFAIKKTIARIRSISGGKRTGGVIWHTQGSGKSLTMVMLAQAISLEKNIRNPKIILVTDRVDLDRQITETFRKCGKTVENAQTGQRLVELLESPGDAIVTTIINKFEAAVNKMSEPLNSSEIFVLVDEGHRTQYGAFHVNMQKVLPNACFVAMTGTPLMKKEKSTAEKFGGIIDSYTVDEAVRDGAVVPLLYEGRHALQTVNEGPIDSYFAMISESLSEKEKADLKKKFSRADELNITDQKIYAIAWDISRHYRDNWQGTGFKWQLVTQTKVAAIKYKKYLDEIGIVSTSVLISAPDEREGEESAHEPSDDIVKRFWAVMMDEHGNMKKYEEQTISRFKKQEKPEIIIVVDKLLTGFDEPKNTVLYLTRSLKWHTLLQAIARVNRVASDKDFGYIVDYYGVLGELDSALEMYSSWDWFEAQEVGDTMTDISQEIASLPQKHSEVWDIFKTVANKSDLEACQRILADDERRETFYKKLSAFAKSLKIALSTLQFHKSTPEKTIDGYKKDLERFMSLRRAVAARYSDEISYQKYESQIQKLVNTYVTSGEVTTITQLVNIFDKEAFQKQVEESVGEAAKADIIASRTMKYIAEKMEEDPAFYKKFSDLLRETIAEYTALRMQEANAMSDGEYLGKVRRIMEDVLAHRDESYPTEIENKPLEIAVYGLIKEELIKRNPTIELSSLLLEATNELSAILRRHIYWNGKVPVVDWHGKSDLMGQMKIDIVDFLFDTVRVRSEVDWPFTEIGESVDRMVSVAKKLCR